MIPMFVISRQPKIDINNRRSDPLAKAYEKVFGTKIWAAVEETSIKKMGGETTLQFPVSLKPFRLRSFLGKKDMSVTSTLEPADAILFSREASLNIVQSWYKAGQFTYIPNGPNVARLMGEAIPGSAVFSVGPQLAFRLEPFRSTPIGQTPSNRR